MAVLTAMYVDILCSLQSKTDKANVCDYVYDYLEVH